MSSKIIKNLVRIANNLDSQNFYTESDNLTKIASEILLKIAQTDDLDYIDYDDDTNYAMPSLDDFIMLEKDPSFIRYKMMLEQNPNFVDETGELRNNLIELTKKIFAKDVDPNDGVDGTILKGYEEDYVDDLIKRNFVTQSKDFIVSEEAAFDLMSDIVKDFSRPEYDEFGRRTA